MAFPPGAAEKGRAKRKEYAAARRKEAAEAKLKTANKVVAEVVSTAGVDLDKLSPEARSLIEKLQTELSLEKSARTAAEHRAISSAEAQLFGEDVEERFTGDYLEVERAKGYKIVGYENRRPVLEPIWQTVKRPIFAYKVILAPNGGEFLSINGQHFYHGMVAKLDLDTLRTVKDMVFRGWEHERNIRGSDENAYRPKKNERISMRGGA